MASKYLAVFVCVLANTGASAQAPEPRAPDPRALDLRSAIRQQATASQVAAPRQLSEPQRGELRRQLSLYSRPPAKGS